MKAPMADFFIWMAAASLLTEGASAHVRATLLATQHGQDCIPRKDPLARFRAVGMQSAAVSKDGGTTRRAAAGSTKKRQGRRVRSSGAAKRAHVLSDNSINAALNGEHFSVDGKRTGHNCKRRLLNGAECYSGLWSSKSAFEHHVSTFMGYSQEVRTETVFHMLQHLYYSEQDAAGQPVGPKRWHYAVKADAGVSRPVCRHVFLLNYPIGERTLERVQNRIITGCTMAHPKKEEGTVASGAHCNMKSLSIIGWYLGYAHTVGDWMPDEQELIVPRRLRKDEFEEYSAALDSEAADYAWFCKVVDSAPELNHVARARRLLNFQHCTMCVDLNEKVKQALKTKDFNVIAQAKERRAQHYALVRGERLEYYRRRERGRSDSNNVLSLIMDKWDSNKTTCPYFARSPGHWWSSLKHNVLEQHVLGILVHREPNRHYFFIGNGNISGGANLNIEGLRRVLVDLCSGGAHLPRTLCVQGDNASDNKCWAVILFLAMLVYHDYVADAFLSFLVVGHTHEDIDQVFSVLSRFIKAIGRVVDPIQFDEELSAAMENRLAHFEHVLSILDWDGFLRPSLISPVPVGDSPLSHLTCATTD